MSYYSATPPDTPDTPLCPNCNIEMEPGHTMWVCPECGYQIDFYPETEYEPE